MNKLPIYQKIDSKSTSHLNSDIVQNVIFKETNNKLQHIQIGNNIITVAGSGSGGESQSELFDRQDLTLSPLGGLPAGSSVFGKTVKQVLEDALYPYQTPSVSFSINPPVYIYENGSGIFNITFIVDIDKKSNIIDNIKIYNDTLLLHTITENVAEGGNFTYEYKCDITSSTVLKVVVDDGKNEIIVSKNITFTGKSYYGYIDEDVDINDQLIKTLQHNKLLPNRNATYDNISINNKKIVYAYPTSYGNLTSILDINGFNYIGSYELILLDRKSVV